MMSESAAVKSSPGRDLVVLVSSFLVYMNFGITFVNGLIVKEMLVIFQAGETLTTWVASLQIGLCLFVGFVAGSLVELYGCRKIVISGTVIGALGFILSAFMPHIGFMFITFGILSGTGLGLQHIPCLVAPQLVFSRRRVFAVACVLCGSSTGCFIYPVMFNGFREIYGFRGALLLWGGIMLNSVPLGYLMTSHPALQSRGRMANTNSNTKQDADGWPSEGISVQKDTFTSRNNLNGNHSLNNTHPGYSVDDVHRQRLAQPRPRSITDVVSHRLYKNKSQSLSNMDMAQGRISSMNNVENGSHTHSHLDLGLHLDSEAGNSFHASQHRSLAASDNLVVSTETISDPGMAAEFSRVVDEMGAGFSELRSGPSLLVFLVIFLMACGYQMPYIFMPLKTTGFVPGQALSKKQAALLVSAMGIADTISRLVIGVIANIFEKQITIIYGIAMLTTALGCLAMALARPHSFYEFLAASIIFGVSIGAFVCVYTQAVIAIVGISKIVRMIGLISFSWGIAYISMPAFGAFLFELSGDINAPFYMAFGVQLLAALLQLGYRISPQYKHRPGAQDNTEKEPPPEERPEPETWSIALSMRSDAASLRFGSHMDIRATGGSPMWRGSTRSRICTASLSPIHTGFGSAVAVHEHG